MIRLYSIHDRLVGYGKPFESENHSTAVRLFQRAVQDPRSDFYNSPRDYTLFALDYFDTDEGVFLYPGAKRGPILLAHADADRKIYLDINLDEELS